MKKFTHAMLLLFLFLVTAMYAQEKNDERVDIDFRNQKVSDIVLSVAKMCGKSV